MAGLSQCFLVLMSHLSFRMELNCTPETFRHCYRLPGEVDTLVPRLLSASPMWADNSHILEDTPLKYRMLTHPQSFWLSKSWVSTWNRISTDFSQHSEKLFPQIQTAHKEPTAWYSETEILVSLFFYLLVCLFIWCFETGSFNPGWPQSPNPSVFTWQMLELQVCTATMPDLAFPLSLSKLHDIL